MSFRVELHPDVSYFLDGLCSAQERTAFRDMCRRIADDPIRHSEPTTEPKLSRYMVRFAQFGSNIAIFGFDRARKKVRIRQCRRLKKDVREHEQPGESADR